MKYHIKITSDVDSINHTYIQTNDFDYYSQLREAFLDEFYNAEGVHIRDKGNQLLILLQPEMEELN